MKDVVHAVTAALGFATLNLVSTKASNCPWVGSEIQILKDWRFKSALSSRFSVGQCAERKPAVMTLIVDTAIQRLADVCKLVMWTLVTHLNMKLK